MPVSVDSPEFRELLVYDFHEASFESRKKLIAFIDAHTEKVRQEQLEKDAEICNDLLTCRYEQGTDCRRAWNEATIDCAAAIRSQK